MAISHDVDGTEVYDFIVRHPSIENHKNSPQSSDVPNLLRRLDDLDFSDRKNRSSSRS
jgi:hypothetical protein